MNDLGFALTGLTSRGGLSNWVFFFLPGRLVMIDVGIAPALKAGAQAGVAGAAGVTYGPQRPAYEHLEAWCEQLRGKAKKVVELRDDEIRSVRLHLRAAAHRLFLEGPEGVQRFALMNRQEADPAASQLAERLGARFETSTSAFYAFVRRHAPFLMK
jgi:hypothetical protein